MKNKLLAVLLSVVVAFGLWLYVVMVVEPESEAIVENIPVVLRGESILQERGLMVTTNEIPTVDMTLYGNRTDLNKIDRSNITIVADLTTVYEPGVQSLSYSYAFPGDVASDAITVQERNPGRITLTVEQRVTKEVPVEITYQGSLLSDEYIADKENVELTDMNNVPLKNNTVSVTGPLSVITRINHAEVEVDLTDRNASFSEAYRFTLCDEQDEPVDAGQVTTDIAQINVTLYIQKVKEIPLKLDIIDGGGATEDTSTIEYEPQVIKVSGSESVLEGFDELVLGTINLGELLEDTEFVFPITLPAGVINRTGIEEITVKVKFPELLTKTFTVTNIVPQNVPEGLVAEIMEQAVSVTVRGPKALVEKMQDANITISVNFADFQLGSATVKADVIMAEGYAAVGATGSYTVSATLREPTNQERTP